MSNPPTWVNSTRKLRDLQPQEDNPREIRKAQAERLLKSFHEFNQVKTITINPDGTILDGHQRFFVLLAAYDDPNYEVDVRVASRPLMRREWQKLTVYLHEGTTGGWDWDGLAEWDGVDMVDLVDWGFKEETLLGGGFSFEGKQLEDQRDERISHVPDRIFESNNEFDIPLLDVSLQLDKLVLPLTRWGEIGRKSKMTGTYHFYTADYKFNALWNDPRNLINSGCTAIIEPNFSTNEEMPKAVGLWRIYQKRWLARYAQTFGIKIWVDLNVVAKFAKYNLLGIPAGWRAFATRGLDKYIDSIKVEYEIACEIAQPEEPYFLVYGGGQKVKDLCDSRGFEWWPENMHVKDGRREADYG